MGSFSVTLFCNVPNVSTSDLPAGRNGEYLIIIRNDGNPEVVEKPQPLYLLPEGMPTKDGGPPICVVPNSCAMVFIDVIESMTKHISGKNALELIIYGPEGSSFRETICC